MKQIAKLDENNVYHGMTEIEDHELLPTHVELQDGCDLPPGKYQWNGQSFHPITDPQRIKLNNPDALNAIAMGFIAIHNSGITLPPETLKWIEFHVRSNDFETAPVDPLKPETFHLVKAFLRGGK